MVTLFPAQTVPLSPLHVSLLLNCSNWVVVCLAEAVCPAAFIDPAHPLLGLSVACVSAHVCVIMSHQVAGRSPLCVCPAGRLVSFPLQTFYFSFLFS